MRMRVLRVRAPKALTLATTLALLAVPALAQDIVYTGCIRSADGSLYSVREGTTPMAPCRAKDTQISWNMAGQPGPPGPAGPSLPPSLDINVNCAEGQSINEALAQQAERLTISISGTCVESVRIDRDDVTLQGVGADPTITAPEGAEAAIVIRGAQRVRIQGLTLTGGEFASLHPSEGASFTAYQLKISNPIGTGLFIWGGSFGFLWEAEIASCQGSGAVLDSGSSLYVQRSQVIDNEGAGLFVQGSVLSLSDGTNVAGNLYGVMARNGGLLMGECTILNNRMDGIYITTGHAHAGLCRIAGNGNAGISLTGSTAVLGDFVIEGNGGGGVWVGGGSTVQVTGASTVNGGTEQPGIILRDTGVGMVSGESSITGFPYGIECAPPPSVAQLTWPVPNTVTTNCPIGQ